MIRFGNVIYTGECAMKADKVFEKLSQMTYGWYDHNNNKIVTPKNKEFTIPGYFEENCYVLTPKELLKHKVGTCWDFSLYAYEELSKTYQDVKFVYLEFKDNKKQLVTHTTVTYRDTNDLYCWIESAWDKAYGINKYYSAFHVYNNIVEIIKDVYNIRAFNYAISSCDITKLLSTTEPITADIFLSTVRSAHTLKL